MTVRKTDSFTVKSGAYEFLGLATVFNGHVRFSRLVKHLEGEVFDIGLDFGIVEFATDETLGIKDTARNGYQSQRK